MHLPSSVSNSVTLSALFSSVSLMLLKFACNSPFSFSSASIWEFLSRYASLVAASMAALSCLDSSERGRYSAQHGLVRGKGIIHTQISKALQKSVLCGRQLHSEQFVRIVDCGVVSFEDCELHAECFVRFQQTAVCHSEGTQRIRLLH